MELTEVSAYEGAQLLLLAGSRDAMAARIIDELGDEISSQVFDSPARKVGLR